MTRDEKIEWLCENFTVRELVGILDEEQFLELYRRARDLAGPDDEDEPADKKPRFSEVRNQPTFNATETADGKLKVKEPTIFVYTGHGVVRTDMSRKPLWVGTIRLQSKHELTNKTSKERMTELLEKLPCWDDRVHPTGKVTGIELEGLYEATEFDGPEYELREED